MTDEMEIHTVSVGGTGRVSRMVEVPIPADLYKRWQRARDRWLSLDAEVTALTANAIDDELEAKPLENASG